MLLQHKVGLKGVTKRAGKKKKGITNPATCRIHCREAGRGLGYTHMSMGTKGAVPHHFTQEIRDCGCWVSTNCKEKRIIKAHY